MTQYKGFKVGDKIKHKACNLMNEIIGFNYDLFGIWVTFKIIDNFKWEHIGHYYGAIKTYDVSILHEYRVINENDVAS